ncbi:MAG: ribosome biogenesis GTPase Der [Oscillospiraceae bacterium]|nr:ribosome biogenesis GTPase Der [Oscillospiraceae bacterium]
MSERIVALVGRPNVGKSTLFNKLSGKRLSIVSDTPGVTRDRIYATCQWNGLSFSLVDTGGLQESSEGEIEEKIMWQTRLAIETCDVIVFVTDARSGLTNQDREVALILRKSGKPIILCVNKCDKIGKVCTEAYEFYSLALGDVVPISSVHGHGTGDLLDKIWKLIKDHGEVFENKEQIKVAITGKPNVGKSSLVNKIVGQERCVVSDAWGTTRDAIDVEVRNSYGDFCFIDTAGLRKKGKIYKDLDRYSAIRTKMAIDRSDVCLMLVDVTTGLTEQDLKIAGLINKALKPCVIVANKCDVKDRPGFAKEFEEDFRKRFAFIPWVRIAFISAKTGKRVEGLFSYIKHAFSRGSERISTGKINSFLSDAVLRMQPPTSRGKRLKIFYMTQVSVSPPTFVLFVNQKKLFHFSYQRYIENRLRESFGLDSTPIRLVIREKGEQAVGYANARGGRMELSS